MRAAPCRQPRRPGRPGAVRGGVEEAKRHHEFSLRILGRLADFAPDSVERAQPTLRGAWNDWLV